MNSPYKWQWNEQKIHQIPIPIIQIKNSIFSNKNSKIKMSISILPKLPLFALSMVNLFVLVISAPHQLSHVKPSEPEPFRGYPMGSLASVEFKLGEYVKSNYEKTTKFRSAINELKGVSPKTERVKKLLDNLNKVGKTVRLGEKPKEMELFEECLKMFAPLKETRQVLREIRRILCDFGYIASLKSDADIFQEAVEFYNKHKTAMLEEVQKFGYIKITGAALKKLENAFNAGKIGEIQKWAWLVEDEMLREIFGIYSVKGVFVSAPYEN